jgi:hypothetical protein
MPIVKAAIVRASSCLNDSLGISTLTGRLHGWLTSDSGCNSVQDFYGSQADRAGELASSIYPAKAECLVLPQP